MYKRTGQGKVGAYPDPIYYDLILYNFDVEGVSLKEEHKRFLHHVIIPQILEGSMFIIQGTASRTGSSSYDQALSMQRALSVKNYIEHALKRTSPNLFIDAIGKGSPIGKAQEAELDRAVRLYGWSQPFRPPPPKPRPSLPPEPVPEIGPAIPPATTGASIEFFIKMTGGISVGEIAQGEYQRFLIWDKIHRNAAYFDRYGGGGALPTPLPGGFTREGDWNRFVLRKPLTPMKLEEFDGVSSIFTSRGTGDVGSSIFTIKPFGIGDGREVKINPFKTGFSFGFSFQSSTVGNLSLDKSIGIFERIA
jgi:hypothetical protein